MPCDPATFGHLKPSAAAELARQIDSLEPNASALAAQHGFSWMLAVELVGAISSGKPDMTELKALGLDMNASINICQAIAARHAAKQAAKAWQAAKAPVASAAPVAAPEPQPVVLPPLPYAAEPLVKCEDIAPAEAVGELLALSLLHTLSMMIESGRADPTLLVREGFTTHTAEEIAGLIRCAHPIQVSTRSLVA